MVDVRCPVCGKLWFRAKRGEFVIEIKCPKCGHILNKNVFVNNGEVVMHNGIKEEG